jgi:hypothetical protein
MVPQMDMVRSIEWRRFLRSLRWQQGDDVTILGPKGSGKTTLELELIKKRACVVLFLTKPRDRVLSAYIKENEYTIYRRWEAHTIEDKIALWPPFDDESSFYKQHIIFREAINGRGRKEPGIFKQGGWTIVIDEVLYFTEELKLEPSLRMLWTQGRSNDLTLVAGSQRPRDIPQLMLSQPVHFFLFNVGDDYEVERIAKIITRVSKEIRYIVPRLAKHEFLYVNKDTGELVKSKVEL